ncbi:MAG: hypothetical protein ACI8ZM_000408 [Crocinitomix sp.]|jgi:hypothetical protein
MGIFGKLFGSKKLKTTDSDFGEIESFRTKGNDVAWQVNKRFLNSKIEKSKNERNDWKKTLTQLNGIYIDFNIK